MIKKLFIFLTITIIGGLSILFVRFKNKPSSIYPFPYFVSSSQYMGDDLKEIRNSDVLIIGDRLGIELDKYIPAINDKLSVDLRNKLKIYNWSTKGEGLHRSLKKLKVLGKLPPIVIYSGGSEEFYEDRLLTVDKKVYDYNISKYKDDRFSSLLMTFPDFSKILYKKPKKYFYLNENIIPFTKASSAFVSQTRAELIYNYFSIQLDALATLSREKSSTFIYITPPINLDIPPRLVCDNAISNTILQEQGEIEKLIESGQSKEAAGRLKRLLSQSIANAKTYYLLGKAQLNQGLLKEAKENLSLASTYDCGNWRSNLIFNKIMTTNAKKNGIKLIDFSAIVTRGLGRDITFVDEFYPQSIYYNKLQKELILIIKSILKI